MPALSECRELCKSAIDCTGQTQCEPVDSGVSACLNPSEIQKGQQEKSDDQSFGIDCQSDPNACGENAPTCSAPIPQATDAECTFGCSIDSDCQQNTPLNCSGDCAITYANSCCVPDDPTLAPGQVSGANLVCRSRGTNPDGSFTINWCTFFAARCTVGQACPGARAGTCQPSGDGGACTGGTRAIYECCTRDGQCGGNAVCNTSLDETASYCTGECQTDDDCADPNGVVIGGSCWTTTYLYLGSQNGQDFCLVTVNDQPLCRSEPIAPPTCADGGTDCAPLTDDQAAAVTSDSSTWGGQSAIPCNISDRPSDGPPDNKYCPSAQTCYNPTTDQCAGR